MDEYLVVDKENKEENDICKRMFMFDELSSEICILLSSWSPSWTLHLAEAAPDNQKKTFLYFWLNVGNISVRTEAIVSLVRLQFSFGSFYYEMQLK